MVEPEPLQQIDRTYVRYRGHKLIYFSGCDYFRLASHPKVLAAVPAAVRRFGLNVAASRITTGNHILYGKLEQQLADFFHSPAALLTPTGYLGNLIVAQSLARQFSHGLIDERAHRSLCDAAQFLECPVLRFQHRDPADLERAVRRCGTGARLVVLTDGMFAHDGSAAPLVEYRRLLPKDAWMLVDDAHGAGVLGRTGRGALEHAGIGRTRIIQTITLSKAFGSFGGAILAPANIRHQILARSSLWAGSTPLPLPLVAAASQGIRLLDSDPRFRQRLLRNATRVKKALQQAGYALPSAPGPVVSLLPRRPQSSDRLKQALLAAGIFPPWLRYPGVAADGYFRFVISSEHTSAQLERLIEALAPAAADFSCDHRTA